MPRARCRGSWRTGAIVLRVCRTSSICRRTGRVLRLRATVAGAVAVSLSAALHGALLKLAKESGASLFMVLQAGLAALLSRLGGGSDIAIGSPIAGRTDVALDDLVGFFVNTLVLRTDVSGNPSFRELLGRVRSDDLAAYGHQDVPFERLVEVLNPSRSLSRHPLFQVMLAFQNNAAADLGLEGVAGRYEAVATSTSKFDLALSLGERRGADGAAGGLVGDAGVRDRPVRPARALRRLLGRLVRLLAAAAVVAGCVDRQSGDSSAEERASCSLRSGTRRRVRFRALTLPSLFARRRRSTPDAVAVVYGDRELSYAALDAHANRLAHHLRSQGVVAETVVGLCVDRSLEMVIGLLGILKAGAAYLPLDPSYPADRLSFMLADAGCAVVVTQQARARPAGCGAAVTRGVGLGGHAMLPTSMADGAPPARASGCRLGRDRAAARERAGCGHRRRPGRLRDLHIRINRNAKGRGDASPCAGQSGVMEYRCDW